MTDWEPATEAETAMRDALRANDQEAYFRVLARTELLLPVSAQVLAGDTPVGWGTWTTGGRTHVLAFTSTAALHACLGATAGPSRRVPFADLATDWPQHEWWLAVNPGLPVEGYLPAWFVSQLSRGDVRLPGRTMGARSRLERAEALARARGEAPPEAATGGAAGPGAMTGPPPTARVPGAGDFPQRGAGPDAPPADLPPPPDAPPAHQLAQPDRPAAAAGGGATAPGSSGPAEGRRAAAELGRPSPLRRRPLGEETPPNSRSSFFEPASGRGATLRSPRDNPLRSGERATPPARPGLGGQPFPRRRPVRPHDDAAPGSPMDRAFPMERADERGASPATPDRRADPQAETPRAFQPGTAAGPGETLPRRQPTPAEVAAEERTGRLTAPARATSPGPPVSPTVRVDDLPPSATEPVSAPPAPRRGLSPIVIEGTVVESRDLPHEPPSFRSGPSDAGTRNGATAPAADPRVAPPTVGPRLDPVSAPPAAGPHPVSAPPAANGASWYSRPADDTTTRDIPHEAEPTRAFRAGAFRPGQPETEATAAARSGVDAAEATTALRLAADEAEATTALRSEADAAEATRAFRFGADPAEATRAFRPTSDPAEATTAFRVAASDPAAAVPHLADPSGRAEAGTPFPAAAPAPDEAATRPVSAPDDTARPGAGLDDAGATMAFRPDPTAGDAAPGVSPAADPAAPAEPGVAPDPVDADRPEKPDVEAFRPANEVEENLLDAAGAGSTDTFLSTLLLARVLLPTAPDSAPGSRPGDAGFVWRTEELDGEPYVVVHTSPERLADHGGTEVDTVEVRFVRLIRNWPDEAWSFAVNPGTPVGAKLPGEQIVALASWAAEVGLGDQPDVEPAPPSAPEPAERSRYAPEATDPSRPVLMQKAVAPSQLAYYLERGYDRVSGFVHRAGELAHLTTPAQLHEALGLGYPDSPFARDADRVYVLRWPAYRPSLYRIPYGGQNEPAMRAMEGWVIERAPFRGNGFAPGESSDVVAEFKVDSARLPHGAQLWRIGADGTERVIAVLDADAPLWRQIGAP
ncbi:SseB family protein [Micromonospora sp. NPDC000089]|uniref:SseB family protein n=1 Tax=unclassified Micromonospora TaxID=2617518 RepID=UPI0036C5ED31